MNENKFKNGDTYCVSCGKPMTSEMGSMICPECQKYLKPIELQDLAFRFIPNNNLLSKLI